MRPGSKGLIGVKGKDAAWGGWEFSPGLFESLMEPGFQDTSFFSSCSYFGYICGTHWTSLKSHASGHISPERYT